MSLILFSDVIVACFPFRSVFRNLSFCLLCYRSCGWNYLKETLGVKTLEKVICASFGVRWYVHLWCPCKSSVFSRCICLSIFFQFHWNQNCLSTFSIFFYESSGVYIYPLVLFLPLFFVCVKMVLFFLFIIGCIMGFQIYAKNSIQSIFLVCEIWSFLSLGLKYVASYLSLLASKTTKKKEETEKLIS